MNYYLQLLLKNYLRITLSIHSLTINGTYNFSHNLGTSIALKNSSGTTIDTLIYQSVPSLVEVRVGSVFTISKGRLVDIKY